MTHDELIAALEAAEGPSDALDRAIAKVCGIDWSPDEGGNFGGYDITPARIRFTSSIDAAMTLVPFADDGEPFDWLLGQTDDGWTIGVQCGSDEMWFAKTPALALCIAALKARTLEAGHV